MLFHCSLLNYCVLLIYYAGADPSPSETRDCNGKLFSYSLLCFNILVIGETKSDAVSFLLFKNVWDYICEV